MPIEQCKDKLIDKQAVKHIAILLGIALVIGIYLVITTVVISKDGVFYIEQAQLAESDPAALLKSHYPGLPFMIMASHKFVSLFTESQSVYVWIYSAQFITLVCQLLAILGLYLIGKLLVGSKSSFMAILTLLILPYPAYMATDVIREWPHLLFLAWGLLALLYAARRGVWWLFGVAGVMAGCGYLVRPEGAQIVIYAMIWLAVRFYRPTVDFNRKKCILSLLVMLAGLLVVVVPYVKIRGRVFSPKMEKLITHQQFPEDSEYNNGGIQRQYTAGFDFEGISKGVRKLADRLCQDLMYYFALPVVIGLGLRFRRGGGADVIERAIILGVLFLYIFMMLLLYHNYDYISRRHCLPLVIFIVFYIPAGIRAMAECLCNKTKDKNGKEVKHMTCILFAIGMVICLPKLSKPRSDKVGYIAAADWLRENTPADAIVATPDGRISFYADRDELNPEEMTGLPSEYYLVKIVGGEKEGGEVSFWVDKGRKKKRVVISHVVKSD